MKKKWNERMKIEYTLHSEYEIKYVLIWIRYLINFLSEFKFAWQYSMSNETMAKLPAQHGIPFERFVVVHWLDLFICINSADKIMSSTQNLQIAHINSHSHCKQVCFFFSVFLYHCVLHQRQHKHTLAEVFHKILQNNCGKSENPWSSFGCHLIAKCVAVFCEHFMRNGTLKRNKSRLGLNISQQTGKINNDQIKQMSVFCLGSKQVNTFLKQKRVGY